MPTRSILPFCSKLLLLLGVVAAAGPTAAAEPPLLPDYHVGNSLTIDAEVRSGEGGLDGILRSAGVERPAPGWQIASGTPLHRHRTFTANDGGTLEPRVDDTYGRWDAAFAGHAFHAVTLQPFSMGSTAVEELDAAVAMVRAVRANPRNADTRLFLYPAWPATPGGAFPVEAPTTFRAEWEAPLPAGFPTEEAWPRTAAGTAWIVAGVEAATGERLHVVPIGEVLVALDARLRERSIAGFRSAWDLYRDALHMGPRPGSDPDLSGVYVATLTMAASLYDIDPGRTTLPRRFENRVDPALAALAQEVVADVASAAARR